ncbi:MAG: hypothetical protein JEY97_08875 [Bacteroidales bacterium]|nr:hypothetical protein [Bacteroidales bacterium]
MAGYKETPRQKMIAMMYLVLTALLALNVSKDMINAFLVVNESIETTNEKFSGKIEEIYSRFHRDYKLNQTKVEPFWLKALEARKLSNEMIQYLENIEFEVVSLSERTDSLQTLRDFYDTVAKPDPNNPSKTINVVSLNLSKVETRDSYDIPTNYFIGQSEDGSKGEAIILRKKIEEYREKMIQLIDPKNRSKLNIGLETDGEYYSADHHKQNWQMHNFYRTILAADITILNKIIAEIKNAEFDVVSLLNRSVSAEDFKVTDLTAKVIPKSNYILLGEKYQAEIFVAAYDSTQDLHAYYILNADQINAQNEKNAIPISGKNGIANLILPANSVGQKRYAGVVNVLTPQGDTNKYYFNEEFTVAPPSATVSPTAMNVFYIGLDNPVRISVPGISDSKVRAMMDNGTIEPKANGEYIVKVTDQGRSTIKVMALMDGKIKLMDEFEFRNKLVPPPFALVAGKEKLGSGRINKSEIEAYPYVLAKLEDFVFEGVQYTVTSFRFSADVSGLLQEAKIDGNKLNDKALRIIKNARKNTRIFFDNIEAKGPDNRIVNLPDVILTLN